MNARTETPEDRKRRESIQATIAAVSHAGSRRPGVGWVTGEPAASAAEVNAVFARRKAQADAIHTRFDARIARLERLMIRLMPLMPVITIPPDWFEFEDGLEDLEDRPLTDWPSTPPENVR